MKPAELLDPENLPEELQWVAEHYRLQPNDPVFLLIAWHWQTVQGSESKLTAASMEMQAALAARVTLLTDAADSIAKVGGQIAKLQSALEAKPLAIAKQLETELSEPIAKAVHALATAEQTLKRSVQSVEKSQQRQTLAAFLIGVVLGGSLLAWVAM